MVEQLTASNDIEEAISQNLSHLRQFREAQAVSSTKLRNLDPDLLIPVQLYKTTGTSDIRTLRMPIPPPRPGLRDFDDECIPDLDVVCVCPKDKLGSTDDKTGYKGAFESRRDFSHERGLRTDDEEIAFSLQASDAYGSGVKVDSFILNANLRGVGVGTAFYERFEDVLSEMGYGYVWGVNNETNIGFFQARGRHYSPEVIQRMKDMNLVYGDFGYMSVKFLEEGLKKEITGE